MERLLRMAVLRCQRQWHYILMISLPRTHKIEKEESYRKLVNDIHSPEQTNWKIPEGVNAVLRPYQVVGYQC